MTVPLIQAIGAGPVLMITCLSYMLFGVLTAQIYHYWLTYKDDKAFLCRYVLAISILATCLSGFSLAMIYDYYVTNFGDIYSGLVRINWEARACIVTGAVLIFMTQGLYIWRIWTMSNKCIVVTSIPAFLLLCRAVFILANITFICTDDNWIIFVNDWKSKLTMNMTYGTSVLTDAVTSSLLIYYLYSNRSGVQATADIVRKLMLYVTHTGAITIVLSLAILLVFDFAEDKCVFGSLCQLQCQLYANTMLAMLNARQLILKPTNDFNSIHLSDIHALGSSKQISKSITRES